MLHAFPTLAARLTPVNPGPIFIVIEKIMTPSPLVNLPIHLRRRFMDQNTEKRIENPYIPMAFEVPTKGETYPETSGWSLIFSGSWSPIFLVWNKNWRNIGAEWNSPISVFLGGLGCFLLGIGYLGQGRVVIHGVAKKMPMRVSHGPALIPSMKNMTLIYIDNQRSTAEKYWSNNHNLDVPRSNSV